MQQLAANTQLEVNAVVQWLAANAMASSYCSIHAAANAATNIQYSS